MWNFHGPMRKCRTSISRREMLQVGGLSIAGLMLPDVLRLQAQAGQDGNNGQRNKSVILIWLRGGASHIDSFDMMVLLTQESLDSD